MGESAQQARQLRTLRASLEYDSKYVSVTWSADSPTPIEFERYEIRLADLADCTSKIRQQLDRLQTMAPAVGQTYDQFRPILRDLANAGADLYTLLMTGIEDDELSALAAAEFRQWFEKTVNTDVHSNWRIHFIHPEHAGLIVPWGLVSTPSNSASDEMTGAPEDLNRFWSGIHRVSCSVVTHDEIAPDEMERSNVRLSAFMEMEKSLESQTIESIKEPQIRERLERHVPETPKDAAHLAKSLKNFDQFWYFWLDANTPPDDYSESRITAEHLQTELASGAERRDRIVFVMLDGDAVIRKDRGPSWLAAALKFGRSGLLAVEADIKNAELQCFGWSILRHVVGSGKPFMEAMAEARTKLWPHSLLFGIYCDPSDVYSHPPDEATIRAMDAYIKTMGFQVYCLEEL